MVIIKFFRLLKQSKVDCNLEIFMFRKLVDRVESCCYCIVKTMNNLFIAHHDIQSDHFILS